jgi:hypothetical protein
MFIDVLRTCGNVAAAARAVGFSQSLIWQRRRAWPGFRQRMEEALEEAEVALEFRIACHGNNLPAGAEEEAEEGTVTFSHGGASMRDGGRKSDCPPPQPFDHEFALRFLKWREEKRRGRGRRDHRRRPPPTIEEVRDEVVRRIRAIRRHREQHGKPEEEAAEDKGDGHVTVT